MDKSTDENAAALKENREKIFDYAHQGLGELAVKTDPTGARTQPATAPERSRPLAVGLAVGTSGTQSSRLTRLSTP